MIKQNYPNFIDTKGVLVSVYPPTEYLTFGTWIYMVPQYKPKDVLILGYAGGTTAGLIKTLYGAIPIVGVDIIDCEDLYGVQLVKMDAREYVKTAREFDCVVVDLFEDGAAEPCDFILSEEFISNLKRIARYIIVHASSETDMGAYGKPLKTLNLPHTTQSDSKFYYYMVSDIPNLPIR